MDRRPWPIIILAFFHLVEPILKILFYSIYFQKNPWFILKAVYQAETWFSFGEFVLLFPLAGLFIFLVKKWSYIGFCIVEIWVAISNWHILRDLYLSGNYSILSIIVFCYLLNIAVVGYFLIPHVRKPYYNPRMRWWESAPRFTIQIPCEFSIFRDGYQLDGKTEVLNISSTGVFLKEGDLLSINEQLNLKFKMHGMNLDLPAHIIHKFPYRGFYGFGVRFNKLNKTQKKQLKDFINLLEEMNYPRRPEKVDRVKDFKKWLQSFLPAKRIF